MSDHNFENITTKELNDYSVAEMDILGKHDVKEVCPVINSQEHVGIFRVYDTQGFNSNLFQEIADGDVAPLATWGHSTDSFLIKVYGMRDFISDRDAVNEAAAIDLTADTATFLGRNGVKQRNSAYVEAALVDNSQWDTVLTGVATAVPEVIDGTSQFQQFDQAAAEPLSVLDKCLEIMLETTGLRGDSITIPRQILTHLKRNDEINQYGLSNPTGGVAGGDEYTISIIAQYCGVEASKIHVIDAVVDKALITSADSVEADHVNEDFGAKLSQGAESLGFISPNNILVNHVGMLNAGRRSQSSLVEFRWTGLYPANGERGNFKLKSIYNENREGLYLEARQAFLFKVVASRLGILLVDAIA